MLKLISPLILTLFAGLSSCGFSGKTQETPQKSESKTLAEKTLAEKTPGVRTAAKPRVPPIRTEEDLRAALKEKNPDFKGEMLARGDGRNILILRINDPAVKDITPLARVALRRLDLSECSVTDLSPLKGKPLEMLFLEKTPVEDISPLKGMPLVQLSLIHTRVRDLSPLREMPQLDTIWLTGCPVSDISPIKDVTSLASLTIAETKVSDLSPLQGHPLLRLHIARSQVTDLSPLQNMELTRLIFTPSRITKGIEFARKMATINEIDVAFPHPDRPRPLHPDEFWPMYDAGEFK